MSVVLYGNGPSAAYIAWQLSKHHSVLAANSALECHISTCGDSTASASLLLPRFDPARGHPDVLLVSLPALKDASRLRAEGLVGPDTTLLVDETHSSPLRALLADIFPTNRVASLFIDNSVYWSPDRSTLLASGGADVHVGCADDARTQLAALLAPPLAADLCAPAQYAQLHWNHYVPFVTLNVLCALFDAPAPAALAADILVKPLFEGIADELIALAHRAAGAVVPRQSLDQLVAAAARAPPAPPSAFLYSSAPPLFYALFHKLDVPLDVLLLNPILMGDDLGIKTPYLECAFALLSTLAQKAKSRILFQAEQCTAASTKASTTNSTNSVGSAVSRMSGSASSSNSSDPDLSELVIEVNKAQSSLLTREQKPAVSVTANVAPAPALRSAPAVPQMRRRMPQGQYPPPQPPTQHQPPAQQYPPAHAYQPHQQPHQQPPAPEFAAPGPPAAYYPAQHQHQQYAASQYQQAPPHPHTNLSRRSSAVSIVPPMAPQGAPLGAPLAPPVQDFDMMSLTQKRSRRQSGRPFSSVPALNQPGQMMMSHQQPFSQQIDLDHVMGLDDGKYGAIPSKISRRLSSSRNLNLAAQPSYAPPGPKMSRSQSFSSQSFARQPYQSAPLAPAESRMPVHGR